MMWSTSHMTMMCSAFLAVLLISCTVTEPVPVQRLSNSVWLPVRSQFYRKTLDNGRQRSLIRCTVARLRALRCMHAVVKLCDLHHSVPASMTYTYGHMCIHATVLLCRRR
jgi:hypothetical protein